MRNVHPHGHRRRDALLLVWMVDVNAFMVAICISTTKKIYCGASSTLMAALKTDAQESENEENLVDDVGNVRRK